MRTLSRVTCAVLAGTALFGVVGLSSTATAAPARPLGATATVIGEDEVSTSATRAFWIENRTSEGMTVYGLAGAGDVLLPDDSLPDNRFIGPGQTLRVEVTSGVFSNGGHQVEVSLTRTSHAMSSSFGPVLAGGEAIVITDGPGTSTVPASS